MAQFINKKRLEKLILLTLRDAGIATILLCVGIYFLLYLFGTNLFIQLKRRNNHENEPKDRLLNSTTFIEEKLSKDWKIGNKRKINNTLGNVLLILVYNFPHYENIKYTYEMYKHIFYDVISCGSTKVGDYPDIVSPIARGYYGYSCAAEAMKRYPNLEGYLYGNDDMIINWWKLVDISRDQIWHGTKFIDYSAKVYGKIQSSWRWWNTNMGRAACQNYYRLLLYSQEKDKNKNISTRLFRNYIQGCNGQPCCGKGWADFFYIPKRFIKDYIYLSTLALKCNLFLEIAVPNIFLSLTNSRNDIVRVESIYLFEYNVNYFDTRYFWHFYNFNISFIHPFKLDAKLGNDNINLYLLRKYIITYGRNLLAN